ncbi:MAG: hypothetical protein K2V38_21515, partial [Gemmataceae bacterium]|nr:hypothetical protein [Gemmataceae bacterium]
MSARRGLLLSAGFLLLVVAVCPTPRAAAQPPRGNWGPAQPFEDGVGNHGKSGRPISADEVRQLLARLGPKGEPEGDDLFKKLVRDQVLQQNPEANTDRVNEQIEKLLANKEFRDRLTDLAQKHKNQNPDKDFRLTPELVEKLKQVRPGTGQTPLGTNGDPFRLPKPDPKSLPPFDPNKFDPNKFDPDEHPFLPPGQRPRIDPKSKFPINPDTGEPFDPRTGQAIDPDNPPRPPEPRDPTKFGPGSPGTPKKGDPRDPGTPKKGDPRDPDRPPPPKGDIREPVNKIEPNDPDRPGKKGPPEPNDPNKFDPENPLGKPKENPQDGRTKAAQTATALWEKNVGPIDESPAVKRAIYDLVSDREVMDSLTDANGKNLFDMFNLDGGDGFGDLFGGKDGIGGKWEWPKLDWKLDWAPKVNVGEPRERPRWPDVRTPDSPRSNWLNGMGSFNLGGLQVPWLLFLVLLVLVVVAVVWWKRDQLFAFGPREPIIPHGLGPWPLDPRAINTREDIVKAFEYLSVLICGPAAKT